MAAFAAGSLLAVPARAHDHWISHNFAWCCGNEDCAPVKTENVRVVPGGYLIVQTGEVIPESQALPSVDGEYWRCQYMKGALKGQTRCFFRGLAGS
jgi:hypothetical protein